MAEFDYSEAISEARAKYESISKALDVDRLTAEAKDLEVKAAEPGLWDDPENAQKVTSKLSAVQSQLKRLASADQRIEDVETLVELGQEEEDADTLAEAKAEVESIQKDLDDMECLLTQAWQPMSCQGAGQALIRENSPHKADCQSIVTILLLFE